MRDQSLKIENARYVVTVDTQRRIIQDGSILIEGGRISGVGKAADLAGARADRLIDARHRVVTPGFFNGHMHISYAHAVRGIFPDDLGSPLVHVFNLQAAMTEEEEYYTSLLAIVELVKNGTVCFVDPGSTKFPDACLQAYTDAGIRVILGECVTDRESPWNLPRYATGEAVARTASFVQKWHGRLQGRLSAWAMPFSPETCSADMLRGLKQVADEHRTGLTLHHGSGPQARKEYLARHGLRPTEYLESIGTLGPNVLLAHALGLDDAEIDCLARTGTSVVMCPVTAAKSGRGVPEHGRMPELLAKGVKVALGCDSPNNSNHLDMVRTMNMAAIQYKDARQDLRLIPAEAALEMATVVGAQALNVGDDLGSIEPGKRADLVLFDTERPEWQALFNPVNNLVYNADGRSVHTVVVDGRVVVEDHRQSFVDEGRLFGKVQEIGERLQARTGITFPRSRSAPRCASSPCVTRCAWPRTSSRWISSPRVASSSGWASAISPPTSAPSTCPWSTVWSSSRRAWRSSASAGAGSRSPIAGSTTRWRTCRSARGRSSSRRHRCGSAPACPQPSGARAPSPTPSWPRPAPRWRAPCARPRPTRTRRGKRGGRRAWSSCAMPGSRRPGPKPRPCTGPRS